MEWKIENNVLLDLNTKAVQTANPDVLEGVVRTFLTNKGRKNKFSENTRLIAHRGIIRGINIPFVSAKDGSLLNFDINGAYFYGSNKTLAQHRKSNASLSSLLGCDVSSYEDFPIDLPGYEPQSELEVMYQIPVNVFQRKILRDSQLELLEFLYESTRKRLPEEIAKSERIDVDIRDKQEVYGFLNYLKGFSYDFKEKALKSGHVYKQSDSALTRSDITLDLPKKREILVPFGGQVKK